MARRCPTVTVQAAWKRQREAADLAALVPQERGPKADPSRIDALQIAQLTRERDQLRVEFGKAQDQRRSI